jgi:hypothetical protein
MAQKIALVTCYFQPNYGSQLQAFATQKFFDDIQVPNETIMIDGLKGEINKAKYKYFLSKIFDANTIKDKWATVKKVIAKKSSHTYAMHLAERYNKFDTFAQHEFHLSKRYASFAELNKDAHDYQMFVVGSDQLWLPSNIAANYYTLNFVPREVPKMALATSFGVSQLPSAQAKLAKEFLPRIDYCSVREVSGQKLIKNLTGRDVPVVCDPTILFTAEEWDEGISKERFIKEKYLLCYFLGNNPIQREFVKKVKSLTGYKIVQLQHCDEFIASDENFPDEAPYNVGPKEFIRLIRDAEYVFTDSFHCSVFSMLFSKRFFTFRRYASDGSVSTNGRIYSLLSLVNLESRLLRGDEDAKPLLEQTINFSEVHQKLDGLRQFTWKYVKEALNKEHIEYNQD